MFSSEEQKSFWGIKRSYLRTNRLEHVLESISIPPNARILDVGAGTLAKYGKKNYKERYFAIDFGNSYTLNKDKSSILDNKCDFENEPLPFDDGQFEVVICTDVLEHLDNPHNFISELFRVTSNKLIVSLPNNWVGFIRSILVGANITHKGGYGLFPRPHPMGQRHKFWFNYSEARSFLVEQCDSGFSVNNIIPRFEFMHDSLLPSLLPKFLSKICAYCISSFSTFLYVQQIRDNRLGELKYMFAVCIGLPLFLLDGLFSRLIYGFRSKMNWFNMVCRGIVVVFSKN